MRLGRRFGLLKSLADQAAIAIENARCMGHAAAAGGAGALARRGQTIVERVTQRLKDVLDQIAVGACASSRG